MHHTHPPSAFLFPRTAAALLVPLLASLAASPALAQRIELLAGSSSGYAEGVGSDAQFYRPTRLALSPDGLNLYVTEVWGNRIRSINTQTGQTALIAGSITGSSGNTEGIGAAARFNTPIGLAWQPGRLLVADSGNNRIRIVPLDGTATSTLVGSTQLGKPFGVAVDGSGRVYVSEFSGNRISQIDAQGQTSLLAGSGTPGYAEGVGAAASFRGPDGIAVRPDGQVLVADSNNNRIRQFFPGSTPASITSTLAGGSSGFADGTGATAEFNYPADLALDGAGRLFVADWGNHRIRMLLPDGTTTTVAGTGTQSSTGNGSAASSATLNQPLGLAVDALGNLYVSEGGGSRIRKIILLPQAPSGLNATPVSNQAGQAQLSWTYGDAVFNAVTDDVQSYRVTASPDGQTCTATAPATRCTVTGLTPGSAVTLSVVAINRAGFESPAASVTVLGPLALTTTNLPTATVGQPYSQAITVTGGAAPSVAVSGLPAGLSFNASTGLITGTPTAHTTGPITLNVAVTDTVAAPLNATLSLTVNPATLAITAPSAVPDATVGQPYQLQLSATGGAAPYTWAATGLPAGLSVDANGLISGTPTDTKAAQSQVAKAALNVSITVTDSLGTQATQALSLTVNAAAAPAAVMPVPSLSAWALALLSALAAAFGLQARRKSSPRHGV